MYRMLMDGRHFYRIESDSSFTEIQLIGNRRTIHEIKASQYPEKVRIQQMIELADGLYEEIDQARWADEWDAVHG